MSSHATPVPMTSTACGPLSGVAEVPGDKSISHRSLILGAMCIGETTISGLLEGDDVLDTAKAMQAFGAEVTNMGGGNWSVRGVGVGGFAEPDGVIDCGNSGTGVRLIMGSMATSPITATFTGDASLNGRPMARVTDPLALFGTQSVGRKGGRLPMTIVGAADPVPVRYTVPVPSAQVKSAVLLAGLNAPGKTVVIEAEATRDHTERMLAGFGAEISVEDTDEGRVITLTGQPELQAQHVDVPRDPSSAAFPVCAALIVQGSDVLVPGIGLNPTRAGLFTTLREMGANLTYENERTEGGEPVADLHVRYNGPLKGIDVPADRVPSMIDEFPILSMVAACADGTTRMTDLAELRVKESDRLLMVAEGLKKCGVSLEMGEDSLTIHGNGKPPAGGAEIETALDHRIAMSFLILGCATDNPVSVDDGTPIATSFPRFIPLMTALGAKIEKR